MSDHRNAPACAPQLPDALAPCIESTHGVLADPTLPAWRKHEALVALAEAAYLTGRAEATGRAVDIVRTIAGDRGPQPTDHDGRLMLPEVRS